MVGGGWGGGGGGEEREKQNITYCEVALSC